MKKALTRSVATTVLAALALAGCVVGPKYERPQTTVPAQFRGQATPTEAASIADLPWWSVFHDKALQALIQEGLANNYDLKIAITHIEQARALVSVARSEAKPQLGYQTSITGQTAFTVDPVGIGTIEYGTLGGVINAAWELDLWGRIKHSTEAAQAELLAREDVRRGVMLSLVTDIATGYFRLVELDRELAIARESERVFGHTLDLFTDRYKAGRDSNLPVQRSLANYSASQSKVQDLQREIAIQENALSVLVGAYPKDIPRGEILTAQTMPETPLGATTVLLERRPDIMAAEQQMVGANAQIGVAIANFFPRVGLSAFGGGIGAVINDMFDGFGVWSAALSVAGPIFTGGRLQAEERQRRAEWDEMVVQYRKTIIIAFQETSDALAAQQTLVGRRTALESQIAALQSSIDLASVRYDSGRASYFEVLQAQQELFPAEAQLAQTERDQLLAVVNLYKALGGGWKLTDDQWMLHAQAAVAGAPSGGSR
ncbi:MAG TPA: efflux transporter outer membrane subunit [Caulobacteraceae bacterium]|jgi:multidrug efflux system outer membrane protein|nr:efflux transporter outer membrane subunit [Caulobacteraceae bacterium]